MILPYDERGEGPTIVLLHAGVADRRMWAGLLDRLAAERVRALAPDLQGFGDAPFDAAPVAPWQDVLETLDAAGVERFALAGNSFGAAIAKRVAHLAPERVSALVLISAPPEDGTPSPRLAAAWEAEEEAFEDGDLDRAVAAVVEAWTLPDAPAEQRELVAQMQRRVYELQPEAGQPPDAPDPLETDPAAFADLSVPLAVAVGEHDMEDFHAVARELAGSSSIEIAGAGHLAPLERPDEVLELLLAAARGELPT